MCLQRWVSYKRQHLQLCLSALLIERIEMRGFYLVLYWLYRITFIKIKCLENGSMLVYCACKFWRQISNRRWILLNLSLKIGINVIILGSVYKRLRLFGVYETLQKLEILNFNFYYITQQIFPRKYLNQNHAYYPYIYLYTFLLLRIFLHSRIMPVSFQSQSFRTTFQYLFNL